MLDKIAVERADGPLTDNPFTLTLRKPTNGFLVQSVDGLDPVKASLVSSTFANLDGEQYHTSRRDPRNITINLELKHKSISAETLRSTLYQHFMPKTEVRLRFYKDDGSFVYILGVVETCESPLFTNKPVASISVVCHKPDFLKVENGLVSRVSTFGAGQLTMYDGTVPTGLALVFHTNDTTAEVLLGVSHRVGGPEKTLRFTETLFTGDVLTVVTQRGERRVDVQRNAGPTESVLWGITSDSVWPELLPGENYIRVVSTFDGAPYDLVWSRRYGGL